MFKKGSDSHALIMAQIRDVEACLKLFQTFMHAVATESSAEKLGELFEKIDAAEDQADASLRAMIDSTGQGSYLPSTREDLIEVATSCDKIANKCEDVAFLITLYKLRFPSDFVSDFEKIFELTLKQFGLLEEAVGKLFAQMHKLQKDPSILDEIRGLETQIDRIEGGLGHRIFDTDLELAAKMQMYGIVEKLCDVSDIIENVADKIQIMLITRKA